MSQSTTLYRLQKLDLEIDARRHRLHQITALLEQDAARQEAQAAVVALQEALRPQEIRAKDLTLEMQSITTQSGQLHSRLYGGKVSNPKELQEMENKLAELKRRHVELEDVLLETMLTIEDTQAQLVQATERLQQAETSHAAAHQTLEAEQHRLKRELKALKADRESAVQEVSAEHLELYQALRTRRQGHAVAVLDGDACSGCGVSQTTINVQRIRQGQALMLCASCGRILVAM